MCLENKTGVGSMCRFVALLLLTTAICAQVPVVTSQSCSNGALDDTDVHCKFVTDLTTQVYVMWDTTSFSTCSKTPTLPRKKSYVFSSGVSTHRTNFVGLVKNTQYFWIPCRQSDDTLLDTSPATAPFTFTTANSAAVHPESPVPPTPSSFTGVTPTSFSETVAVASNCSDLQTIIDDKANDVSGTNNIEITVPSGNPGCTAGITLKNRSGGGTGWIVIRPTNHARLPPDNARVDPTYHQQHMFQLSTSAGTHTIQCDAGGASKYLVIGAYVPDPASQTANAVKLNNCTDVYVDRSYLKGTTTASASRRHIDGNDSVRSGVINSELYCGGNLTNDQHSCFTADNANTPLLRNNRFFGSGNLMVYFQDATLSSAGTYTRHAIVKQNLFEIDAAQKTAGDPMRMPIEMKACGNCSFEGNSIKDAYISTVGFTGAFLISPRWTNGGDPATYSVHDIEISHNFLYGGSGGLFAMVGGDGLAVGTQIQMNWSVQRIAVHDNTVVYMDDCNFIGGDNLVYQGHFGTLAGTDVQFYRNTWYSLSNGCGGYGGKLGVLIYGPCGNCTWKDSIGPWRDNGGFGGFRGSDDASGWPDGSVPSLAKDKITEMWPSASVVGNVFRPVTPSTEAGVLSEVPAGNSVTVADGPGLTAMGFASEASTSATTPRAFRLNEFNSAYRNAASGGRSPGADWINLLSKTGGVEKHVVSSLAATEVVIGFQAPGGKTGPGVACHADLNTSSTYANAPIRVTATVDSAIPWWQTATFTTTTATTYYGWIHCGGVPYRIASSITTP